MEPRPLPFDLPPNWYRTTIERLIDTELPPVLGPLTAATAWRYVYTVVAWAEPVGTHGTFRHLNDRLSTVGGRELAQRGEEYLRANITPQRVEDLLPLIDRISLEYSAERARQNDRAWWQRNNITGNALRP